MVAFFSAWAAAKIEMIFAAAFCIVKTVRKERKEVQNVNRKQRKDKGCNRRL